MRPKVRSLAAADKATSPHLCSAPERLPSLAVSSRPVQGLPHRAWMVGAIGLA